MGILDRFNKKKLNIVQPVALSYVKDINDNLEKEATERIRETLKDYALAITDAEDPTQNDVTRWERLLNLYLNIELDDQISCLKTTILSEVTQTPFKIVDKNGNENKEIAEAFEKTWFYDFIKYCLESDYWPWGLLQFINPIQNGFEKVDCINRFYVRPSLNSVSKYKWQDRKDFDYSKSPLKDYTLFVKSNTELGLYSVVAKKFILKREVNQYWAIFNELFTTPYWTVKTNFNDSKHRNDLLNWLTKRKHSGFAVVGLDDEIQQLTNSGSGFQSYKDFEIAANESMTKVFLGGTMVTDNGSSRSQAEVHEKQKKSFIQSKRVWLKFIINEQLIPKMNKIGNLPEGLSFQWDLSQQLTITELVDSIQKLSTVFSFDEEEISGKIGLLLKEKQNDISSKDNFGNNNRNGGRPRE